MPDLIFKGQLKLFGELKLASEGGKVKIGENEDEVLVADSTQNTIHGSGIPVIQPPPPASPIDTGKEVKIINSFNSTLTIKVENNYLPVVALGICIQGNPGTWPGMVLPSTQNTGVLINGVKINVQNDNAITLPNGGTVVFDQASGQ